MLALRPTASPGNPVLRFDVVALGTSVVVMVDRKVPSIRVNGVREPVCRSCVERVNPVREKNGLGGRFISIAALEAEQARRSGIARRLRERRAVVERSL